MGIPDKIMIPLIAAYFIASLVFFGLLTTANPDDTSATAPPANKSNFDLYAANSNAMMQLLACQITLTAIVWETEAKKHSKRRKEISLDYESFLTDLFSISFGPLPGYPLWLQWLAFGPFLRRLRKFCCTSAVFFSCAVSVFLAIKIRVDLIIAKRNESTHATEICKFRTSVELKVKKTADDNYLE
jgi:hypothetical protein